MFTRIFSDPAVLSGKPCINGTRISVEFILELVASGASRDDIIRSYPHLTAEDVEEAPNFAAHSLSNETIMTAEISGWISSRASCLSDENIHPQVVQFLRQRGCDVADVATLGLKGQPDAVILTEALNQSRIVVTHDRDFGRLAISGRQPLHGIVFLRPGHIDPQFTIATMETIGKHDFDLSSAFILVARRRGTHVQMRLRRW